MRTYLDDPATPLTVASDPDGGQGRIEQRRASMSGDAARLQQRHAWLGLKAVGQITAKREIGAKPTIQTRTCLLSNVLSPKRLNELVRAHWDVENRLHWVLDVIRNEDQARNRNHHGPENLALLRRLALNPARLEPSKGSLRGKLKRAGWNDAFLSQAPRPGRISSWAIGLRAPQRSVVVPGAFVHPGR